MICRSGLFRWSSRLVPRTVPFTRLWSLESVSVAPSISAMATRADGMHPLCQRTHALHKKNYYSITDYQRVREKRGRQVGAKPSYMHIAFVTHGPLFQIRKSSFFALPPLVGELPEQDQVSSPKMGKTVLEGVENQHAQHRTFDRADLPDQNGKSTCDATNVERQTVGGPRGSV
jgi:hypothetical protein